MTDSPLKLGFTKDEFSKYVDDVVAPRMSAWRPRGVVLHNTWAPDLKTFEGYIKSGKWTAPQLVENWWTRYRQLGWRSGPHLFIARDKIWLGSALWTRGTHSPSFNSTHWAAELIGNYAIEILPNELRANAVSAIADLYAMIGHEPGPDNFKYHGEDPRTTHKLCPGKNVGSKAEWIARVRDEMNAHAPGEHEPATAPMPVMSQPLKGTTMPQAQVDFSELIKAFDDATPKHVAEAKADKDRHVAEGNLVPRFGITDVTGGFCKNWTAWKKDITKSMWIVKYFLPSKVMAIIMGLLSMADSVHSKACAIPPAE